MERVYKYAPQNVCSYGMIVKYDDQTHIINKIQIIGGCGGNTQGVSRLAEGRTIEEVVPLIENIRCPGSRTKDTSCPAQLAIALQKALIEEKKATSSL